MTSSSLVPSLVWLRQYPTAWLRPDVTAGLTSSAGVIPKAMAYATIASLPLQVGLYTAFVPLVERARPEVLVLDRSAVFDIEYPALKVLVEAEERLREEGISLWLAALNSEPLAVVQRSKLGSTLGRERMFFNLEAAVARYEALGSSSG